LGHLNLWMLIQQVVQIGGAAALGTNNEKVITPHR